MEASGGSFPILSSRQLLLYPYDDQTQQDHKDLPLENIRVWKMNALAGAQADLSSIFFSTLRVGWNRSSTTWR